MKKIIFIFVTMAVLISNAAKANSIPIYIAPSHTFSVNIPYIQLENKRFYLDVHEGVGQENNFKSYWVDFSTPPELRSITSKFMYITISWDNPNGKHIVSDSNFYKNIINVKSSIPQKIIFLFPDANTQFINSKKLRINGRAAYQLTANIFTPKYPDPIKGIFTFINFKHHIAFVSMLPVLPVSKNKILGNSSSQALYWNEYNQILYSLKSS